MRLTGENKSEMFFKVFYERMKLAQQEIKATVTVNTSDLGSKKKDEEPPDKDTPTAKGKKGQGSRYQGWCEQHPGPVKWDSQYSEFTTLGRWQKS